MIITPNFNLSEFNSHDGKPYPPEWIEERLKPLCEALEVIREATGGPIHILSGYRSPEHNKKVGGAEHSQHVEGRAVDIVSKKLPPDRLGNLIEFLIKQNKLKDGGLGVYHSWCHFDLRPTGHARWKG